VTLRRPDRWWTRSRFSAAVHAALCIAAACLAAGFANWQGASLLSTPAGQLLGVGLFPFLLALAVLRHALRQQKIDREEAVWEER